MIAIEYSNTLGNDNGRNIQSVLTSWINSAAHVIMPGAQQKQWFRSYVLLNPCNLESKQEFFKWMLTAQCSFFVAFKDKLQLHQDAFPTDSQDAIRDYKNLVHEKKKTIGIPHTVY